jgi:hypothetical protein
MACTVALLLYAVPFHAQTLSSVPPAADVESIDAIIAALYDVISGPAGERDWDRFRSLFVADARLIPTGRLENGRWTPRTLSVDGYVERAGSQFRQQAFYEDELHREVQRFGHVAHAFSTYASRRAPDAEPFSRGINSIQLFWDGTRWWVVSIMWDAERDGQVIPPEYLGRSGLR